MKIIGCDYHPSFQQIAMLDLDTGDYVELRLLHAGGEAHRFYESLSGPVRVGVESSGNMLWFERLLQKLGHELWLGDAGVIRAKAPRKQKTDVRDARHLLQLLRENNFPRLWVPSVEERDLRQLLKHRHTLVQMRTRVKNQLQHIALNQGMQKKRKLWTQAGQELLRGLELDRWTARRRDDLLHLLAYLERTDRGTGSSGESGGGAAAGSAVADDASGSGPGGGLGHGVDAGRGGAVSARAAGGSLRGPDSQRGFQRAAASAGSHHQTRQQFFTFSPGASRGQRGEGRCGVGAGV